MRRPHVLVLSSGGLRGLVAAALASQEEPSPRLTLLHILDGRDNLKARRAHLQFQAQWLGCKSTVELSLPHLYPKDGERDENGQLIGTLVRPQLLLAAVSQAQAVRAERVIYPGNGDGDTAAYSAAAEQLQLCEHLGLVAGEAMPSLEAPLLELTDAQVIQLGDRLGVPWHAAWSCGSRQPTPCQACTACHRRRKAFDAAGSIDTQHAAVAGR